MWGEGRAVFVHFFSFYKNLVYKNVEAEIWVTFDD